MNQEIGRALNFLDFGVQKDGDAGGAAFGFEHGEDIAGGTVAEKLVQSFLVIRDFVFFDQRNEIGGRVACDGGLGEMRIGREAVLRAGRKIGEVAAAATGKEDFLSEEVNTIEY